jgi:hypothetical protein
MKIIILVASLFFSAISASILIILLLMIMKAADERSLNSSNQIAVPSKLMAERLEIQPIIDAPKFNARIPVNASGDCFNAPVGYAEKVSKLSPGLITIDSDSIMSDWVKENHFKCWLPRKNIKLLTESR